MAEGDGMTKLKVRALAPLLLHVPGSRSSDEAGSGGAFQGEVFVLRLCLVISFAMNKVVVWR